MMIILISIFPAMFANWFITPWASHCWIKSFLSFRFTLTLFAWFTFFVMRESPAYIRTLDIKLSLLSGTWRMEIYFCAIMMYTISNPFRTKEAFCWSRAITWNHIFTPHPSRSFSQVPYFICFCVICGWSPKRFAQQKLRYFEFSSTDFFIRIIGQLQCRKLLLEWWTIIWENGRLII